MPNMPFSAQVVTGTVRAVDALLLLVTGLFTGRLIALDAPPTTEAVGLVAALISLVMLNWHGSYRLRAFRNIRVQGIAVLRALVTTLVVLCSALALLDARGTPSLAWAATWITASMILLAVWRGVVAVWVEDGWLRQRVAIVGGTTEAASIMAQLLTRRCADVEVIGLYAETADLPSADTVAAADPGRIVVAGAIGDLVLRSRAERLDTVLLALPFDRPDQLARTRAALRGTICTVVLPVAAPSGAYLGSNAADGIPVVVLDEPPLAHWKAVQKAIFDRIAAFLVLLLLSPVLFLVAILIRLDTPGPIIFRQHRLGYNNIIFTMWKFRSMHQADADCNGDRLTSRNDPRITRVGRWLRKFSIDELPQLVNVLRGEMSMVGPRPHALGAKAGGTPYASVVDNYAHRHRVRPGITGLAQVNGWRGETWTEEQLRQRVRFDLHYIENWSLKLDFWILLLTLWREIRSKHAF